MSLRAVWWLGVRTRLQVVDRNPRGGRDYRVALSVLESGLEYGLQYPLACVDPGTSGVLAVIPEPFES